MRLLKSDNLEENIEQLLIQQTNSAIEVLEINDMNIEEVIKRNEEQVEKYTINVLGLNAVIKPVVRYFAKKGKIQLKPSAQVVEGKKIALKTIKSYVAGDTTENQVADLLKNNLIYHFIENIPLKKDKHRKWKNASKYAYIIGGVATILATIINPISIVVGTPLTLAAGSLTGFKRDDERYALENLYLDKHEFNNMSEYSKKEWNAAIKKTKPKIAEIIKNYND